MRRNTISLAVFFVLSGFFSATAGAFAYGQGSTGLHPADTTLLDRVQRETFNYFWEGGEPISGAAPERIHMDGVYPQSEKKH